MKWKKRMKEKLLLWEIRRAGADEISQVIQAGLCRYRELFPDYDFHLFSLPRGGNREQELQRIAEFLREHPGTLPETMGDSHSRGRPQGSPLRGARNDVGRIHRRGGS